MGGLGAAAVIIAAGLVFWLKSAWPDLIVAGIATLFLNSGNHPRRPRRAARAATGVTFTKRITYEF